MLALSVISRNVTELQNVNSLSRPNPITRQAWLCFVPSNMHWHHSTSIKSCDCPRVSNVENISPACPSPSTDELFHDCDEQPSPDPFPIFHSPPAIHIAHVKRWLSIGGGRKKLEISSTHGQRQSSWLRLCRLPEDGGNAGADGKTCDDRFLQPGREVA